MLQTPFGFRDATNAFCVIWIPLFCFILSLGLVFRISKFPIERISSSTALGHISQHYKIAASASKSKCADYDGKGDINVFLPKVELVTAIKGHTNERKAQFVASKLPGPAFDVYMRLTEDDKRETFNGFKEHLKKKFRERAT